MASGTAAAVLAALKTKAAAAVLASAVVVGGGATAVAAATGAIQLPGHSTTTTQHDTSDQSAQDGRTKACADNGDAKKLASDYKAMFGGDEAAAKSAICQIYVDKGEQAVGFGKIRQALNLAAWIESKGGSTACLTATPTNGNSAGDHGQPTGTPGSAGDHGQPTGTPGNAGDHAKPTGTPGSAADHAKPTSTPGSASDNKTELTIPSASASTTQSILKAIFDTEKAGTPIAQQASACDAPHGTDAGADATPQAHS